MTEASRQALEVLRSVENFQWHVVPLLVLVIYVYAVEIEKRNWGLVLAGLAFWGMDWANEIVNGLILHLSGISALWTAPAGSAYVIFVGLNIEISLMFAILGIVFIKMLPKDKEQKILGIPNRWFFVVVNSLLCVFIEIFLNGANALIWEYWWWNVPFIPLIVIFGLGLRHGADRGPAENRRSHLRGGPRGNRPVRGHPRLDLGPRRSASGPRPHAPCWGVLGRVSSRAWPPPSRHWTCPIALGRCRPVVTPITKRLDTGLFFVI
jgi:hypothetical protein